MKKKNNGLIVIAAPDENGMTVRGILRQKQDVSQRLIKKIIHGDSETTGALYLNGKAARFNERVKAGDEIRLVFPAERSWIQPEDIPISIIYEDEDILVIDKQPGIIVHPTKGYKCGTVANAVIFHMTKRGEDYKPRFVSRLDMGTSGILIIGKNSHAQNNLSKQSASGGMEKFYITVLEGRLEDDLPPSGIIDIPIGQPNMDEPKRAALPEAQGGSKSQTAYEILKMVQGGEALTVVRAQLLTGRTHQIRVHFAHYGHPVLGDHLYGSPSALISRQALHAEEASFTHPVTGEKLVLNAPIPEDIGRIIG